MTFAHGEFRVFLKPMPRSVVSPSFTPRKPSQPRRAQAVALLEKSEAFTLHCERCRLTIDRDLSAARSLSLRCLATPSLAVT
jgi:hypothetical protein